MALTIMAFLVDMVVVNKLVGQQCGLIMYRKRGSMRVQNLAHEKSALMNRRQIGFVTEFMEKKKKEWD